MTKPPSQRGQGRKPISPDEETTTVSIRVTISQRAKLALLGGGKFVRRKIDRAKVKPQSDQ